MVLCDPIALNNEVVGTQLAFCILRPNVIAVIVCSGNSLNGYIGVLVTSKIVTVVASFVKASWSHLILHTVSLKLLNLT